MKPLKKSSSPPNELYILEEQNERLKARIRVLSEENRDQRSLINALMEKTPFGLIILDQQRRVLQVNTAAESILNISRVSAIGKQCTEFFICYQEEQRCPALAFGISLDRVETRCVANCTDDKILLRSQLFANYKGEEVLLEAFVDITELKNAQHEKERALRAKEDFLAKMSHELRTPLNAIIGYSEILHDELEQTENQEMLKDLDNIHIAGHDLLHLVDEVLDIHKIQADKIVMDLKNVNVADLLHEIQQLLVPLVARNNNQLLVNTEDSTLTAYADRFRLRQILLNIIGNACKFTRDGTITVSVNGSNSAYVNFTIEDTGIGISKENLDRVFQAFEQADSSTTRDYGGAGLGLAIAKQFTELMHGELSLSSTPGKGSCFVLRIPANHNSSPGYAL